MKKSLALALLLSFFSSASLACDRYVSELSQDETITMIDAYTFTYRYSDGTITYRTAPIGTGIPYRIAIDQSDPDNFENGQAFRFVNDSVLFGSTLFHPKCD